MKQSKLNQIIEEKVLKKLTEKFEEKGFKYKKGIRGFYKRENGILYEVTIYHDYELFMSILNDENPDEKFDNFYLTFEMCFRTKLFEFEKWYLENFGKGDHARIATFSETLDFAIPLNENVDFVLPDDFGMNQKTFFGEEKIIKRKLPNNIYQFSSWDMIDEVKDFDTHINIVFSTFDKMMETKYDFLQLYNSEEKDDLGCYNSEYMKYNALLIFDKQFDLPTKFITSACNEVIAEINQMTDEIKKEQLIQSLNRFISIAENLLDLKIHNPFKGQ